jgi:hypothetical protein
MKMGAIIRLECFIKTKNPEIQYKISLFSQLVQVRDQSLLMPGRGPEKI